MRAIFISYRRDDSEGQAGRLFDDLVSHFGEGAVFMDVAGIEPGTDFRRAIDTHVASCGVLLAVIGKSWLDAKDESGRRRLEDAGDFVRLETASALKRDIPVVPVLVQDAKMPRAEQLPPDLKELAYRNGVELTHPRWNSDVQVLVKTLERHVKPYQDGVGTSGWPKKSRWMAVVAGLMLFAAVIGAYSWYEDRRKAAEAAEEESLQQPPDADASPEVAGDAAEESPPQSLSDASPEVAGDAAEESPPQSLPDASPEVAGDEAEESPPQSPPDGSPDVAGDEAEESSRP